MTAQISSTSRTLEIDVAYTGGNGLNQQMFISEIHLTLDTEVIVIKPQKPLEITGPRRIILQIPKNGEDIESNLRVAESIAIETI